MIPYQQRVEARRTADERERRHELRGDNRKWTPNGYSGADIHYMGILGEIKFHNEFGSSAPDLRFIAAGDDGSDLTYRGYPVDVKVSTYYGSKQYLRVPVDRMHRETIYVAAVFDSEADDVHLLRWEWGWKLAQENNIQRFGQHPTNNYVKLVSLCRRMCGLRTLEGIRDAESPRTA